MRKPTPRWMRSALLSTVLALLGVLFAVPAGAETPVPGISIPLPPPSLTVGAIAQQAGAPTGARIDALVVSTRVGEITWDEFDRLAAGEAVSGVDVLRAVTGVPPSTTLGALTNGQLVGEAKAKNDSGGTTILSCIGCTIVNNPPPTK